LAATFYREVVDKLRIVNLTKDLSVGYFEFTLAESYRPPQANEQIYRELVGMISAEVVAAGCANMKPDDPEATGPEICQMIPQVFSAIQKYDSKRAATLKVWAPGEEAKQAALSAELEQTLMNGTADEVSDLVAKSPTRENKWIYRDAVTAALNSNDIDKARQIAARYQGEARERAEMAREIDRASEIASLGENDGARIQRLLNDIPRRDEQVIFLLQTAARLLPTNRSGAMGLLQEAESRIAAQPPGKFQLDQQIRLATLYCQAKSDRAFAIMDSVVPRLNSLAAAATSLDGFENHYLRDGEWSMTGEGPVGQALVVLAQLAGDFARLDFDRSVKLANQFERPELRLMALEKLAQSILAPQTLQGLADEVR